MLKNIILSLESMIKVYVIFKYALLGNNSQNEKYAR